MASEWEVVEDPSEWEIVGSGTAPATSTAAGSAGLGGPTPDPEKTPSMLWGVTKTLAPVAADVIMTMALPEAALLKIARIPGFSKLANTVVSKWGPEMLRRFVGVAAGAGTATALNGPAAGVGYGLLAGAPAAAGALAEGALPATAGAMSQVAARGTGGAAGGAAGTVGASLVERGELPSPLEVGLNTVFAGGGEAIAGAPMALSKSLQPSPRVAELKTRYPQLANVPDAMLENEGWQRRILNSVAPDPLFNPVLAGEAERTNLALRQIGESNLGVRPPAEVMAGAAAPNLDEIRGAADRVIQGFDTPLPAIPEAGMGSDQVFSEMTRRLDTPRPAGPNLPAFTPTTAQETGVSARVALAQRAGTAAEESQSAYGRMLRRIEAEPEVALPLDVLQGGVDEARKIAGVPVIPEGGQRALRTAANVERAISPGEAGENIGALLDEFPELFGDVENTSLVTSRNAPRLLEDLAAARGRYSSDKAKKMIGSLERSVWDALEQSGLRPEAIQDLRQGRATYGTLKGEIKMGRKALRATENAPERMGSMIARFDPEKVSEIQPGTIFGSLTAGGFDVKAHARNLLVSDLANKLERAEASDLPKLLSKSAQSPLFSTAEREGLTSQSAAWKAFLDNPKNAGKAREYLDVLTGKGPKPTGPMGTSEVQSQLVDEATAFAQTLPEQAREAIGRTSLRNFLQRAVKAEPPVKGGPAIAMFDPAALSELTQGSGGLSLVPPDELRSVLNFARGSTESFNDVAAVADTIAKLYEPKDYSGLSNLMRDYFKAADPRKIRQTRDLLKKVPGGEKAWNDFATAQLSTNMFEGTDFSVEKLINLFEDEAGKMVPRETLEILTEHIPESNRKALLDLYDLSKRTADQAPGRANPAYSALRTAASMGKTAAESTGFRSVMTRVIPSVIGAGLGSGAGPIGAAVGAGLGAATSMGFSAMAGMAPLVVGKTILSKGEGLKRYLTPLVQSLENVAMQTTSGAAKKLGGDRR